MKKSIKDLYYNYQAISENLTYFGPILNEQFETLDKKIKKTEMFYEHMHKIIDVIKEFHVEDELNEEKIKEINELVTLKLLSLGYATKNENDEIELNIDKKIEPVKNIDDLYESIRISERNKRFLYNNAVVNSVTSYEQFVGQLLKEFYTCNPDSVNSKSLTLKRQARNIVRPSWRSMRFALWVV